MAYQIAVETTGDLRISGRAGDVDSVFVRHGGGAATSKSFTSGQRGKVRDYLDGRIPQMDQWVDRVTVSYIVEETGASTVDIEGGWEIFLPGMVNIIDSTFDDILKNVIEKAHAEAVAKGYIPQAQPQMQAAAPAAAVPTSTAAPKVSKPSPVPNGSSLDPIALSDGTIFYPRLLKKVPGKGERETDVGFIRRQIATTAMNPRVPQHCIAWGGPGTGKTVLAEAVVGEGFEKASFSSGTELSGIVGYEKYVPDPATVGQLVPEMVKAALLRAYTHQHDAVCRPDHGKGKFCPYSFCLLDEMNTLALELMPELHPFLDGSPYVTFEGVTYRRGSDDFYVMGSGNPYAGPLTDALKSRLLHPIEVMPSVFVARKVGVPEPMIDFLEKCIQASDAGVEVPSIRTLVGCIPNWEWAEADGWRVLMAAASSEKTSEEWEGFLRDMVEPEVADYACHRSGHLVVSD